MNSRENEVIERHIREPRIAQELIAMLRKAKERGHRTGFRTAWEVLRWRADVDLAWGEAFKLNNTLSPIFGRLVRVLAPDLVGSFEVRAIRGFDEDAFAARVRARLRLPAEPRRQLELPLGSKPRSRMPSYVIATWTEAVATMELAKRLHIRGRGRAA
jgi:hypothetical protein